MPGICQYSVDRMNEELDRVKALQIPAILIFGIPEHKDEVGSGAYEDYMLAPGQQMVIDTGYLAMMDATCSLNAETVKGGAMNMFFGGEGFFNTVVTGPGKITLQTMPKSQLAAEIASMIPSK